MEAVKDGLLTDRAVYRLHVIHLVGVIKWLDLGLFRVVATAAREIVQDGIVIPALERDGTRVKCFAIDGNNLSRFVLVSIQ